MVFSYFPYFPYFPSPSYVFVFYQDRQMTFEPLHFFVYLGYFDSMFCGGQSQGRNGLACFSPPFSADLTYQTL